jgi:lysophospholipase L1-like esterase
MLGTNDAGTTGGADKWNAGQKEEFYQEAEMLLYRITNGSPNAKFVFMNAPHRCDGNPTTEAKDAAMRKLQLTVAKRLQADGYTIRFYDMESYTAENLVEEGKTCAEKAAGADKESPETLKAAEIEAHGHYYNLLTDTGSPDSTHPSYLGYGKIAAGVKEMILHLFDPENVSAPKYMVSLDVE